MQYCTLCRCEANKSGHQDLNPGNLYTIKCCQKATELGALPKWKSLFDNFPKNKLFYQSGFLPWAVSNLLGARLFLGIPISPLRARISLSSAIFSSSSPFALKIWSEVPVIRHLRKGLPKSSLSRLIFIFAPAKEMKNIMSEQSLSKTIVWSHILKLYCIRWVKYW